jgi:cell division protein FtsQ
VNTVRVNFKVFLVLLLLAGIMVFIISSDIFSLKNIYVTGNKTIPKDVIINVTGLQYGQSLFKMNKKKIYKNLFNNPKVKAVRIRRILPSSLSLDIIERVAVASIPYLGSYLNIDEEALIIEVASLEKDKNVPVLEGLTFGDFKTGEIFKADNDIQLTIALEILSALKTAGLDKDIILINIGDTENIELTSNSGISVIICNSNLEYKIQMAKLIIEDLEKKEKEGIIDMKHDGNPIFKERE